MDIMANGSNLGNPPHRLTKHTVNNILAVTNHAYSHNFQTFPHTLRAFPYEYRGLWVDYTYKKTSTNKTLVEGADDQYKGPLIGEWREIH